LNIQLIISLEVVSCKGQKEKAMQYAALVEQYAIADTSGLRYHKSLGLVDQRVTWLDNLIQKR